MSKLIDTLNSAISSDPQRGIFFGGQGIIVRNLDDGLVNEAKCRVVPGTFWHNDIWPPNQIYPAKTDIMAGDQQDNWLTPTLAVAISPEHFDCLFDTPNLQDKNWTDGVWYAHDSNSCDKRGLWVPNDHGYDAPYAWIDVDIPSGKVTVTRNSEKLGSGGFDPGNPTSSPPFGGGGTGVHVENNWHDIDAGPQVTQSINQIDGKSVSPPRSLVVDYTCQIDYWSWNAKTKSEQYDAVDGWLDWIQVFSADAKARGFTAEAWIADLAMGWLNNPRPMITLQNALWKYRADWCTGSSEPPDPNSFGHYWGWNEIPFCKEVINNSDNWTCFVIVLPPGIQGLRDALKNETAKANVIDQLETYSSAYNLIPNKSSIALVRQIINPVASLPRGLVWMREFFAEDVTIGGGWHIENDTVIRR